MEAYVRGLARFLGTPERYPAARSLKLEFFLPTPPPVGPWPMAACLASAFRWSKLDRLAVYAFPRLESAAGGRGAEARTETRQPAHVFPDPDADPVRALLTASRLATLHVKNCLAQSGYAYSLLYPALTRLTIEITAPGVKAIFPSTYFGDILLSCRGLVFLRLVSCYVAAAARPFPVVELPLAPALQELILEACYFRDVRLASAPRLERLVIERCNVLSSLTVGTAPRLATLVCRGAVPRMYGGGTASLRFVDLRAWNVYRSMSEQELASFFLSVPKVEVLKLCFMGPPWVYPATFSSRIENLKKLLIDIPRVWPLHQIKKLVEKLLEAATCLEKLHIHFFSLSSETSEELATTPSSDSADDFQHTFLRQIVMEGFEGTKEQIALIRLLLSSCTALKTILLIRHRALPEIN